MRLFRIAPLVVTACLCAAPAAGAPILIDFESLTEFEDPVDQFAALGVTFGGATTFTSGAVGGTLNELDFPPLSGFNVILDSSPDGIQVSFANGATSVGAYLTYVTSVSLTAYSGATVLGSVSSLFDTNTGSSGNAPNELLQFSSLAPITHVIFQGSSLGFSFTLDDFSAQTIDSAPPPPIPEPGTATLVALGAAYLIRKRKTLVARRV